jgi:hypothetical protein
MAAEDRRLEEGMADHGARGNRVCCVYWCREQAVVIIELDGGQYGCCRKHAAFIQAGKMDWFER